MSDHGLAKLQRLVGAENGLCTLACVGSDGAPHTSVVNAGVMANPATGELSVATVVRSGARKVRLMRADPRVVVTFRHSWDWMAVRGSAALLGPDDPDSRFNPATLPDLLREVFRAAGGTHDDWDTFDRVMAEERRLAVFVSMERLTDNGGSTKP